jgi:hypothetical protein
MIDTINTTLYQRPKPLNGVGMDIAFDINLFRMVNDLMVKTFFGQRVVGTHFIGINRGRPQNPILNLGNKCVPIGAWDNSSGNPTMTLYDAKHGGFIGSTPNQ